MWQPLRGGKVLSKPNHEFFIEKKSWFFIKDELLQCYLLPYFQKLMYTRCPITYVDCFAGAGRFDDGNDGSPLIALKSIKKSLEQTKMLNPDIQSYFIEVNHFEQLNENLKEYRRFNVFNGKFEDEIGQILKLSVGRNLFLYIDPYGIKELEFDFLSSLGKGSFNTVEILLNFNSVAFLRTAFAALGVNFKNEDDFRYLEEYDTSLPKSFEKTANKVAGGEYWKKIIEDYYNGKYDFYGAEERFVAEYCKKLREHYRYVLNMPIRVKVGRSPKYRMIHVTNHPDGLILMADNMLRREKKMRELQRGKQISLFEDKPDVNLEKTLYDYLSQFSVFKNLKSTLADFFCTYGVVGLKDIIMILKKFEKQGQIFVERKPSVTDKGKPTKFWEEKGKQTVRLKWNI